jgi:predicted translation initiation factor SUI1
MAKLTSLSDLASLLPASEQKESVPQTKTGYNGKPQKLKVTLDTKRRGKTVTIISGFQSNPRELDTIAQSLKKSCGAGGSVLDNVIEIQGDHTAKVKDKLRALGFIVA